MSDIEAANDPPAFAAVDDGGAVSGNDSDDASSTESLFFDLMSTDSDAGSVASGSSTSGTSLDLGSGPGPLGPGAQPKPPLSLSAARLMCRRIPMWGLNGYSIPSVWLLLRRALPKALHGAVRRVVAVRQLSGVCRHDLYLVPEHLNAVLAQLRKVRSHFGFFVRASGHIPWRPRQLRGGVPMPAITSEGKCAHNFTTVCSINVNSLRAKKTLLEVYLWQFGITVCGIQETWRSPNAWRLRVSGYQCVERVCGIPGSSGVALLVADGLSLIEVGRVVSPFFIFGRVCGVPLPCPMIFGSVYIPCAGDARKLALTDLSTELEFLRHRFPDTPLVLVGDFNHDENELDRRLNRFGSGMIRVRGSGSMLSTHCKGKPRGRAIDHIAVSAPHQGLLYAAQIDRSCDLSDHWCIHTSIPDLAECNDLGIEVPGVVSSGVAGDDSDCDPDSGDAASSPWVFVRPRLWEQTYDLAVGRLVRDAKGNISAPNASGEDAALPSSQAEASAGGRSLSGKARRRYLARVARNAAKVPVIHVSRSDTLGNLRSFVVNHDRFDVLSDDLDTSCLSNGSDFDDGVGPPDAIGVAVDGAADPDDIFDISGIGSQQAVSGPAVLADAVEAVATHGRVRSPHISAERLTEAILQVASDAHIRVPIGTLSQRRSGPNLFPRGRVLRAVLSARAAYRKWVRTANAPLSRGNAGPAHVALVSALETSYVTLRSETRRLIAKARRDSWSGFISKSVEHIGSDPKALWQWAKRVSGVRPFVPACNRSSVSWRPIRDPAHPERLLVDREDIRRVLTAHFASLGVDPDIRSSAHWNAVAGGPALAPLPGLLKSIEWRDVVAAIRHMGSGKAAGSDTIPAELYKLVVPPAGSEACEPECAMGRALLGVLRDVWATGTIPELWQSSVIVGIDKKGDPLDVGNLRGISLMQTALKILCTMVATNLSMVVESERVLHREQAGFRRREECLSQVISLWEVLNRRRQFGKLTIATFIDYKAAFDCVPHEALFARLRHVGVVGPMLSFIEGLYETSSMRLRLPDGSLSEPFPLGRGVRQGCPISPMLFDIFIDTLFDDWVEVDDSDPLHAPVTSSLGVDVPGVDESTCLPGLLFADDAVVLAGSLDQQALVLQRVSTWSARWHMTVNQSKCGVILFTPFRHSAVTHDLLVDRMTNKVPETLFLQGSVVPVVSQYTYLGCVIDNELSLKTVVLDRAEKARRSMMALVPFLSNHTIPLHLRTVVFVGTVMACALYGAELWGGSLTRVAPIQRVINQGLRLLVGSRMNSSMPSMLAVWRELNCPPVHGKALVQRFRAICKYPSLHTWVSVLMAQSPSREARRFSWVQSSKAVESRVRTWAAAAHPTVTKHSITPERCMVAALAAVWTHLEGAKSVAKSATYYTSSSFCVTSMCCVDFEWSAADGACLVQLIRARVGSFITAYRTRQFNQNCPDGICEFCSSGDAETLAHVLFSCDRWLQLRKSLLYPLFRRCVEILHAHVPRLAASAVNLQCLLLGGAVSGVRLSSWDRQDGAELEDTTSVVSDDLSLSSGSGDGWRVSPACLKQRPACFSVARFLGQVALLRRFVLHAADPPD
jgi:exonuclease III